MEENKIPIPVVVKELAHGRFEIYIPDFDMSVYGDNYVEAITSATFKVSAIYFYNLERNNCYKLSYTYEQAEAMCKKSNCFATYTTLIP